jgi:hypothetical protein
MPRPFRHSVPWRLRDESSWRCAQTRRLCWWPRCLRRCQENAFRACGRLRCVRCAYMRIDVACETSFRNGSNARLVELLLQARADPNERVGQGSAIGAKFPLLLAAASGLTKVCVALHTSPWRFDVTVVDAHGEGAYQLATNSSRHDCAPVLSHVLYVPRTEAVRPTPQWVKYPDRSKLLRRSMTTYVMRERPNHSSNKSESKSRRQATSRRERQLEPRPRARWAQDPWCQWTYRAHAPPRADAAYVTAAQGSGSSSRHHGWRGHGSDRGGSGHGTGSGWHSGGWQGSRSSCQ